MGDIDPREFGGLQSDVRHLTDRMEKLEESMDRLERRIADLTALLDRARGVRWFVALLIGIPTFFAAAASALKTMVGR